MRLILDSCISSISRDELTAAGHDVVWVGDWPADPGDAEILERAHRDSRVLVTLDKDFGELTVREGRLHTGIIRLIDVRPRQQAALCVRVIDLHAAELEGGAIVTARLDRIRVRQRLPDENPSTPE